MTDQPPIIGASALAKVERARAHLREVGQVLDGYVGTRSELHAHQDRLDFVARVDEPIPAGVPLMVGDFLHNLRSALDHLVYECNGKPEDRSCQFPVWSDRPDRFNKGKWRDEVKRRMKEPGAAKLRGLLEDVEAYPSGKHEVVWLLHELDIIDKHRLLLTAVAAADTAWFAAKVVVTSDPPTGEVMDHFVAHTPPELAGVLAPEASLRIELDPHTPFPLEDGTIITSWSGPGVHDVTEGGVEFAVILRDPQLGPDQHFVLMPLLHKLADEIEAFLRDLIQQLG